LLHRMGGIENHRTAERLQLEQAVEVNHQGVLAKACAALRELQIGNANVPQFRHHLSHVPGARNWPFFTLMVQ
jgi:hypothetical protein